MTRTLTTKRSSRREVLMPSLGLKHLFVLSSFKRSSRGPQRQEVLIKEVENSQRASNERRYAQRTARGAHASQSFRQVFCSQTHAVTQSSGAASQRRDIIPQRSADDREREKDVTHAGKMCAKLAACVQSWQDVVKLFVSPTASHLFRSEGRSPK